jgi:hypothetical protein
MMAGTWFVMIPPGYADKADSEKEKVDFRIQYPAGSQAWTDANAGKIVQGAEGNTGNPQVSEQLVKWKGPFDTEAEAKTAQAPKQQSPNPVNDAVGAAENSTANPIAGLEGIAKILGDIGTFIGDLFNAQLWIDLGWLLLGFALFIGGIVMWIGPKNLPIPIPI